MLEILRGLKRDVHDEAATIGFCGAPWTLATYAIEGGSSRSFAAVKTLMHREPNVLEALLGKLADACGDYLAAQIRAGADVVQIFDTWAGELVARRLRPVRASGHRAAHREAAAPRRGPRRPLRLRLLPPRRLLRDGCPSTSSRSTGSSRSTRRAAALPGRRSRETSIPASSSARPRGSRRPLSPRERPPGRLGHILNLGHGILPATPPENVAAFVAAARLPL